MRVPVSLRRIAFPLRLVGARLASGGERALLIVLGVAAGAAVLAAVLGGRLVMQDRSLALATAQLQPADRQVQVTWSGAVDSFPRLNAEVVPQLTRVTGVAPAARRFTRRPWIDDSRKSIAAAGGSPVSCASCGVTSAFRWPKLSTAPLHATWTWRSEGWSWAVASASERSCITSRPPSTAASTAAPATTPSETRRMRSPPAARRAEARRRGKAIRRSDTGTRIVPVSRIRGKP